MNRLDRERNRMEAAMLDYAEQEGKRLEQENEKLKDQFQPTEKARRKFYQRLTATAKVQKNIRTFRVAASRTAACLLVFILISGILVCSVSAVRNKVLEMLINMNGKDVSINLSDGVYLKWAGTNTPAYIPEGFSINGVNLSDNVKQIEYRNKEQASIFFMQQNKDSGGMIDTENTENAEEITIHDSTGYLTEKDGSVFVLWNDGVYLYMIQGGIDKEELIKMAESVSQ